MTRRSQILLGALALTLAATWWASSVDEDAVPERDIARPPDRAGAGRGASAPAVVPSRALPLAGARAPWPAEIATLMPAPAAAEPEVFAAVPAAEPGVPPLPFRYLGMVDNGGVRTVILQEGELVHMLRTRERIDDRYRVERITPTRIEFTYLPLRERQVLETDEHEQQGQ